MIDTPLAQKIVCFAPMLKVTTPHYLYLLSLMSKHLHLYGEMIITRAILDEKNHERIFVSKEISNHLALQLAGHQPHELEAAIKIINHYPVYNEINLNVGCPSKRADAGTFGVCLMQYPEKVALAMRAMKDSTDLQVSLKCRIGIDQQNNGDLLRKLIDSVLEVGACDKLILHARPAIMKLKPKQNWEVPALNYPLAFEVRQEYPELPFILNGGIRSLEETAPLMAHCDGVMIGRAFEAAPALAMLADAALKDTPLEDTILADHLGEQKPSPKANLVTRKQIIIHQYLDYCAEVYHKNTSIHPHYLFIPLMHCFHQQPLARKWRITIGGAIQKRPPYDIPHSIGQVRATLDEISLANDNEEWSLENEQGNATAIRY